MFNFDGLLFAQASNALGIWDWGSLILYFVVLLGIAWWVIAQKTDSSKDYFLAGRHAGWFVIGCSLFASNIGSEHLVGLAGTGASDGMAMAHYELHAWCLLVLGWIMVPFYLRSGVYTMPEFLERRYSPSARTFLTVVSLIAYVFTKISVTLFAGGIVFKAILPVALIPNVDNFWVGAIGMVVITGLYTILGGLRAVLYTEAIQTIVMLGGAICVLVIGLQQVGGWSELKAVCQDAPRKVVVVDENDQKVIVNKQVENEKGEMVDEKLDHFNLWKPLSHKSFPWFGLLFGAPIVGMWYWCTDQYIVQRTLAAKDQRAARRGTIFGAYLKLTPVFLFIVPGMIAYALAAQGKIGSEVLEDSSVAFPVLVKEVLPIGIKGIVIGGLLAALMSSLASVYNSSATLFTMDIYAKMRPNASETSLVWMGRLTTAAMVVLGLLWIPIIPFMGNSLYEYLQSVQAYIAPPIFAVFFLGVFLKRINAYGCMCGLVIGFCLGMLRMVMELIAKSVEAGGTFANVPWLATMFNPHLDATLEYGKLFSSVPYFMEYAPYLFATASFTYIAIFLTVVCSLLIVGISLVTPRPKPEQVAGLTYATSTEEQRQETRVSWNKLDVILTVGLLVTIIAIYIYFRG
ncbi:MAG: sodium:solute symporter [Planctomycetaceae bacterium]|nr:sodium:solute symporter [Planctomycetaceae bacterium]